MATHTPTHSARSSLPSFCIIMSPVERDAALLQLESSFIPAHPNIHPPLSWDTATADLPSHSETQSTRAVIPTPRRPPRRDAPPHFSALVSDVKFRATCVWASAFLGLFEGNDYVFVTSGRALLCLL